jgi:hypothetical protein
MYPDQTDEVQKAQIGIRQFPLQRPRRQARLTRQITNPPLTRNIARQNLGNSFDRNP